MADTLQVKNFSVSLTVDDLTRSRHFYTEGLGFAVDQEMKDDHGAVQGVLLSNGTAMIGLSQDDFAKGRNRVKAVGVSLYLETGQDVAALAARARAAGLRLDGDPAPMPWGPLGFSATDPDGLHIYVCNLS